MHAPHGLVDGVLLDALPSLQTVQGEAEVVFDGCLVELAVVLGIEVLQYLHLFNIGLADVGRQVEVEGRDGLPAVHLVLCRLHADAGQYAGGLYALGWPALAVSGLEPVLQYLFQWVLHAGQALRRVVVLVVDVKVVVLHGLACIFREQVVINEWLGGFAGEFHHHAGRRVRVHVGVLARHVVVFYVDDFQEYVPRLGLACHAPCVAVLDVYLRHVLARAFHQLVFHHVLYLLHAHLALPLHRDAVGYLGDEGLVLALFGGEHRLADGSCYLLFIEPDDSPVSFFYGLYHNVSCVVIDVC